MWEQTDWPHLPFMVGYSDPSSEDKRVWFPDETCLPFHMENNVLATTVPIYFFFQVPSRCKAVIAWVAFSEFGGLDNKRIALVITEGRRDQGAAGDARSEKAIPIHGALLNVEEFRRAGALGDVRPTPGFCQGQGTTGQRVATRPVRVVLREGQYQAFTTNAPAGQSLAALGGWVFPLRDAA